MWSKWNLLYTSLNEQRRKLAAIETDNKILLERLTTIVQSKIDDKTHPLTAVHASFKIDMLRTKKRIETQKITSENQRLLQRIRNVPPAYHHADWEAHARISERHKRSMSLYPEYYKKGDRDKSEKEENQLSEFDSATRRLVATAMASMGDTSSTPMSSRSSSLTSAPPLSSSPKQSYKEGKGNLQGNLLDMGISKLKLCDNFRLPPLS